MPKRVSEIQKKQISESFINGKEITEISEIYEFSKQTIVKQLKSILGNEQFNIISNKLKNSSELKKSNVNNSVSSNIPLASLPSEE